MPHAAPRGFPRGTPGLPRGPGLSEGAGRAFRHGGPGRIAADRWWEVHPDLAFVWHERGMLRGLVVLVPLAPQAYREFRAGRRFPRRDARAEDILSFAEYARRCWQGLYLWLESFRYADGSASLETGRFLLSRLSQVNLRGLLAESPAGVDESSCRWLGLTAGPQGPDGTRLWFAEEDTTAGGASHPLGRPVPLRTVFLTVRGRFGPGEAVLALTPIQRRIARLFYLEEKTEGEIGTLLGIRPNTVKAHLGRIRTKAEPIVGSRLSRGIASWLRSHPSECLDPGDE